MSTERQPLRSFLFAPGNHARRVEKALTLDTDTVILDLEDAVAIAEKPATREAVAAVLRRPRQGWLYVRVNAVDTDFCYGDLGAIVAPGLDGIVLPKVESPAGLATIDWLLSQLERERGLPAGQYRPDPDHRDGTWSRPAPLHPGERHARAADRVWRR